MTGHVSHLVQRHYHFSNIADTPLMVTDEESSQCTSEIHFFQVNVGCVTCIQTFKIPLVSCDLQKFYKCTEFTIVSKKEKDSVWTRFV